MADDKKDKLVCQYHADRQQVQVSGRLLWPKDLLVPSDGGMGGAKKYSTSLLLPKSLDIGPLIKLEADAAAKKHGPGWERICKHRALHKTADSPYDWLVELADEFPMYLRANQSEKVKPFVATRWDKTLNGGKGALVPYDGDGSDIYSGRWAQMMVDVWAYDNVSKGVKFGPKIVVLRQHDTELVGIPKVEGMDDLGEISDDADAEWAA